MDKPADSDSDARLARYSRQVLFDRFGPDAQQRLMRSRVALFGCGALGSVLADTLVRAGVGAIVLCDRDYIEIDNLQRQVLFDEADIEAGLPKAEAAARKLRRINSEVEVEGRVVDVDPLNIESLAEGADVLLDGTDNFETRYLINDLAVKTNRPWVYGAVIGATGLCMPIIPGETACLRCVFEAVPPPEMNPTCDTAGVLAPAVKVVAATQAMEAMKILGGLTRDVVRKLINIDLWTGRVSSISMQAALDEGDCPCCKHARYEYLEGKKSSQTVSLCGRGAVQIRSPGTASIDLGALAEKLGDSVSDLRHNEYLLQATLEGLAVTVFQDGRAIIKGTRQPERAKTVYAKYIGA